MGLTFAQADQQAGTRNAWLAQMQDFPTISEAKGKRVVLVYPVDKWLLMLTSAILGDHAQIRNLGDVKWCATEDGSAGKGTGRHIACFILEPGASS